MASRLDRLRATINATGRLVRDALRPTNLLALIVLLVLAYVGVTWLMAHLRDARLARERQALEETVADLTSKNNALKRDVGRLEAMCEELRGFVKRLGAESRVAEVKVVGQRLDSQNVPIWTLEFTETDRAGGKLPARVITVRGGEVYFDALVIKFTDDLVKVGDPLRGKSLHFFRRAFGSAQEPRQGPLLAAGEGEVPDAYRSGPAPSSFERAMWQRFWHWAERPDEAEAEGVRVAQIEAVGIRPAAGASYRITLEHDGGLNIKRVVPANP